MSLVKKNGSFFYLLLLEKHFLEIMFRDDFDRKELFLAYKNMHFK